MNWKKAARKLKETLERNMDIDSYDYRKTVLEPLRKRYNKGERSADLYDKIMSLEG